MPRYLRSVEWVTIYDSLEQMYGDLCLDLELHSKSGILKYKKDKSDVLMLSLIHIYNHSQKKKGQIAVSFKEHCFLQR